MDIKHMTLEQKIGQLIMAGFPSKVYDEHINTLIEDYHIGNIIFFSRNIGSKEEVAELTKTIQHNAVKNNGIPAFISVDQEGGMVTRLHKGATLLPGNMAVAASAIKGVTFNTGEIAGEELRALGININIAPVMDVNNNAKNPVIGIRSYGDDAEKVAILGTDYIRGLQSKGVIATAKHFPGHGDTEVDSHLDLPMVPHEMDRLENVELYPFKRAIEQGVEAIMSAHVLFKAIEPEKLPGTLSHKVLTGLLREKMRFKGLIFTDCMEMNAIGKYFGTAKAALMAIKAGADLVCVSHQLKLQIESFNAIKEAVLKGELNEERIDESVMRILGVKEKYGLFLNSYPDEEKLARVVGCSSHLKLAREISEKSITLVKDEKGLIPIKTKNVVTFSVEPLRYTGADELDEDSEVLCTNVSKHLGGAAYKVPLNPSAEEIKDLVYKASKAEVIIVGTYNANLNRGQVELINELYKTNRKVIVIALRNPYDILEFNSISTYICAYEYTKLSIKSLIKVLSGVNKAVGRLPVKLNYKQ